MISADSPTVSYSADLPLSWQVAPVHDEGMQTRQLYANLVLLRALATIEAAAPIEGEHDRDSHLAKTLERLESKLDIALSLIARLSGGQAELPRQLPMTLGVQYIEWIDMAPPKTDQEVTLTVYLSPRLPEPLILQAKVMSVLPVDNGSRCIAELLEHDEEFLEWMTRTVFRYHRRALQARHQQAG